MLLFEEAGSIRNCAFRADTGHQVSQQIESNVSGIKAPYPKLACCSLQIWNREPKNQTFQHPMRAHKYLTVFELHEKAGAFLKVHKHEIFLNTFIAETETIWSQGPVTRDF